MSLFDQFVGLALKGLENETQFGSVESWFWNAKKKLRMQ